MTAAEAGSHTILAVGVIVVVAHLFGRLARRLGQPPVLGEIVGGIVILTVGLERAIIDETVFTIMVIMALATTLMAVPVLGSFDLAPPESQRRTISRS